MSDWNERRSADADSATPSGEGRRFYSLLFIASALTLGGVVVGWVFGASIGFLTLKAVSIDLFVALVSALLAMHACHIRGRQYEAAVWQKEHGGEESPDVWDILRAKTVHYVLLAFPGFTAAGIVALLLFLRGTAPETVSTSSQSIAVGIVLLAVSCVWLVLAKAFSAIEEDELPETFSLGMIFREAQWLTLFASAGILLGIIWRSAELWIAWIIALWVVALTAEQLIRVIVGWLRRNRRDAFVSPLRLMIRDVIFLRGNPLTSLFETVEERFGVSFRSSWAIRFVKRATIPAALLVLLLFWGLSSLAVVETNQLGIRETFGKAESTPLKPGLHLKLPWPMGRVLRYPVKTISTVPIGFVVGEGKTNQWETSLLWTKAHAKEEYNLALGDGTQFVAVNALLYFKIRENNKGLFDYAFEFSNPNDAMEAYAYRTLLEWTRSAKLEDVLSVDRAEFAQNLEDSLRKYVDKNELGIDIVDLALINLHPPLEVGKDYLDVISAQIDAERLQIEARGVGLATLAEAEEKSLELEKNAKEAAAQQIGAAYEESAQFVALGKGFSAAPDALMLRLWYEALETALSGKRLIIVDEAISEQPGGILFDGRPVPLLNDILENSK